MGVKYSSVRTCLLLTMVVVTVAEYQLIVNYIRSFDGLWIECGKQILNAFSEVDPVILSSIVSREGQNRLRQTHSSVQRDIKKIMHEYKNRVKASPSADDILLGLAAEMRFSPISLSRIILPEFYRETDKKDVSEMLKNPNLIPDLTLAVNVLKCQMNDNLDGPITDNIRRFVGEEYEVLVSGLVNCY